MKSIRTEININAPIETVWSILMDFKNYPNWNPFIHITGKAAVGQQLSNTIFLEGQQPQTFKPTVLTVVPEKTLRWEGNLLIKGIFDGEHYFQLEKVNANQTKLIHGENFKGVISGLLLKMVGDATKDGFKKMNQALKAQCEMVLVQV